MPMEALLEVKTFEVVEKYVAAQLRDRIVETKSAIKPGEVKAIALRRQDGYWADPERGGDVSHRKALHAVYEALVAAADLFDLRNKFGDGFVYASAKDMFDAYGHEFTADDLVYTFARAMSASGQVTAAAYVSTTGGVIPAKATSKDATAADKTLTNQVVAIDKYTVEFNLFANTGLFPTILGVWNQFPFDSVEMKKHATADDPWSHHCRTQIAAQAACEVRLWPSDEIARSS